MIYNKKIYGYVTLGIISIVFPFLLEILNNIIFKKEGEKTQKTFAPKICGVKGAVYRGILTLGVLPYKAYISIKAVIKTLHRLIVTHKHFLEWTTSEEAEKQSKTDIFSYYNQMAINVLAGVVVLGISIYRQNIFGIILAILWCVSPFLMYYISRQDKKTHPKDSLNEEEKQYVLEVGKRTWEFFNKYLNEKCNYLIPDNYQEDRKEKIVYRTSSTNIGLSLLAVISAYDLGFIELKFAIEIIENIINTIESLPKWNGHLYNWYDIKTKEPLIPRYISTVDSGNFIGYLYVVKTFLIENKENLKDNNIINIIENIIKNTDFSVLYSSEHRIFSIGFNIEENKLTDSYYDLLASEARQASLIAIAKKDVPAKHWNSLSRTLTAIGKYKGLVSWSGTAFEYLMPNINIPNIEGSLLDESCKFMIMNQLEYTKRLKIPWGISESAFNLKDLHSNYQYKAFGIPWLGLKRGLADEFVISSYGSILAISYEPKKVIENLKILEEQGLYNKYGFYESVDYTPSRVEKGKNSSVVKTYMAHHQGLILLSINNLFNNNILQKRFIENPEIDAITILLQETMPEKFIITKENKEKTQKLKYKDYEEYVKTTYTKIDERLVSGNVIANENYTIAIDQKGRGISKYKDIYINRFKNTDDYMQGIFFNIKNVRTNKILSSAYSQNNLKETKYEISFMPDKIEQKLVNANIKVKIETTLTPNESVEIRRVKIENIGNEEELLEITSYFEPVLSPKEQDYAHKAFNNLFLGFEYDEETNSLVVNRRKRSEQEKEIYMAVTLYSQNEDIGELQYEINLEKLVGRGNLKIPNMVKNSLPFFRKVGLVTEPVIGLKRITKIKPNETIECDLIISVGEERKKALENLQKLSNKENIKNTFQLSRARQEAESRYLRIKGNEFITYQKMLSYIIFDNPIKKLYKEKCNKKIYNQKDLWKYGISGDLPIILLKIRDVNDSYVIKEVLKAYEFFRTRNVQVELVILDEEKHSYENYVREEIESCILSSNIAYLRNIKGGIFNLIESEISKQDKMLLHFVASIIIDTSKGGINNNLKEQEEEYLESYKQVGTKSSLPVVLNEDNSNLDILEHYNNLKYYNEYGAFSSDGKEYLIKVNKNNRLPTVWAHILSNEKFGCVITENMGGYVWYKNSRLNRVTNWENSPSYDIPSEVIYIKNEENNKQWSLGLNPMPDEKNYNIIYGFGYAKYIHRSDGILQELEIFVPKNDSVKIYILNLKNETPNRKKIKLYYYNKPVIGEDEIKSNGYINIEFDRNNNILTAKNLFINEISNNIVYVSSSEKIKSYTGDKNFFLGNGGLDNPDALKKVELNNENSLGKKPCMAYEIEVELESFSNKEIIFMLGAEDNIIDCKNIAYKYSKIQNCKQELNNVKMYWKDKLEKLQVYTPIDSINIMLNGWVSYQIIQSRLLARSGYYQSGGAYGYRDQLQDTFGLKYLDINLLKNQIIKHSKHQFIEGDVEHWWHEETKRGIRTRFSDDLLWLVFAVIEYIKFSGDYSILEIETPYLEGKILQEGEDEKYDEYKQSNVIESIYKHCIKAIEKSLDFGQNGLPKIGSGDWNDGFSTVGNKGIGESVWLGFFLFYILDNFINICKEKDDIDLANKYEKIKLELKKALNTNAWDGRWYKRAFTDDGNELGSMKNEECKIDSIAQSFSVISNAGDNDKKYIAMESLENHLIDRENGIIKLLDPPFDKGNLKPGYIKSYMPGVRENGGQYTHECCY